MTSTHWISFSEQVFVTFFSTGIAFQLISVMDNIVHTHTHIYICIYRHVFHEATHKNHRDVLKYIYLINMFMDTINTNSMIQTQLSF